MKTRTTVVGLLIAVLAATTVANAEDAVTPERAIELICDNALTYQQIYNDLKASQNPLEWFRTIDHLVIEKEHKISEEMFKQYKELKDLVVERSKWSNRLTDWATDEGTSRANRAKALRKRILDNNLKLGTLSRLHEDILRAQMATIDSIMIDSSYAPIELARILWVLEVLGKDVK